MQLLVSAGRLEAEKLRLAKHISIKHRKPSKAMAFWSHDGWEIEYTTPQKIDN